MNVLGVDIGKKRTGLAWVDTAIGVILPYGVIEGSHDRFKKLTALIKSEKIVTVVFGLPLTTDGEENDTCRDIRSFGSSVEKETGVTVAYEDERFSSRFGDALGGDATRDEKAAMAILDTFVQKNKK